VAARTFTLDEVQPAFVDSWHVVREWLGAITPEELGRPSAVDGWSVADLTAHIGLAMGALIAAEEVPDDGDSPMSVEEWTRIYRTVAAGIDRATRARAEATSDDLLGALDTQWQAVQSVLAAADGRDLLLSVRQQNTRLSALIVSRLIEIIVHGDDLARSLPERPAPEFPRDAQRIVVRTLLDMLSIRAPGRSVEVRVPPFAAVQCVEGPRHTRGTPPNTIQADPLTWMRLATGRTGWDQALASGSVLASGERADLRDLLPLL
jgi:uncharacterized protein (TIGR03083 family)